MVQKKLPTINSAHDSETRNIINEIIKAINDRGLEILSESGFLTWLEKNGIKHREEVATFADLPSNDPLNTVRGVLDDNKIYIKKENGWIEFQTIDISKINFVERKVEDITVNVRNFGAVGDGVTDDRQAIIDAKEEAASLSAELYIPSGNFFINGDLDLSGVRFIKSVGTITFANTNNKLTIKYDSSDATSKNYHFGDVNRATIEVQGLKNAQFSIAYCRHLKLYADSASEVISSIAYNSFYPGRIDLLEINSLNGGWINENKFFGGRLVEVLIDGEYNHNHNIFYGPTFENTGKPATITINKGNSNNFYDVRWEGSSNKVVFGESTWDNTIERSWTAAPHGYQLGSYRFLDVVDNGVGNATINSMDKHYDYESLYSLSISNGNFNTDWVDDSNNNLKVTFEGVYERFYETGIFEVLDDFSVDMTSDSALWRLYVYLYDSNLNLITDSSVIEKSLKSFNMNIFSGSFQSVGSRDNVSFSFKKTTDVKYMEIFTRPEVEGSFGYLNIYKRKKNVNKTVIPTLFNVNNLRGSHPPKSIVYNDGAICWNTEGTDGSIVGWKLSEGVWKPFGDLNVKTLSNYGTYIADGTGTKTFWTIPHGLSVFPEKFGVTPGNDETGNFRVKYVNATGNNLVVFLSGSVPEGSSNVKLEWWVEGRT